MHRWLFLALAVLVGGAAVPEAAPAPQKRVYRIAVVPFTENAPAHPRAAAELHALLVAGLGTIDRYVLVPTAELERVLGPLQLVRDFSAAGVRETLKDRLRLDVLLQGKVEVTRPDGFYMNSWLLYMDSPRQQQYASLNTRLRYTAAYAAESVLLRLNSLRISLGELMAEAGNTEKTDGQPLVVCLMPWTAADGSRGEVQETWERDLAESMAGDDGLRLVLPDKVRKVLEKNAPLSAKSRAALRGKFKADILLAGEVDERDGATRYTLRAVRVGDGAGRQLLSGRRTGSGSPYMSFASPFQGLRRQFPALRAHAAADPCRDAPTGDGDQGRTAWAVLVPPIDAGDPGATAMARAAWAALNAQVAGESRLRLVDFARARALFPALVSAKDLTKAMLPVLRDKLGVDFVVHGQFSTTDKPALGAWRFSHLSILAHSGKSFGKLVYGARPESMVRDVLDRFAALRTRGEGNNTADLRRHHERRLRFFDEETADLKRGKEWKAPGAAEAGTLVEVAARGFSYAHYLHRPPGYDKTGYAYPLVVFLHGVSSKSDALTPVMFPTSPLAPLAAWRGGLPGYDRARLAALDPRVKGSFVLVPQVPTTDFGWESDKIFELVLATVKAYPVDLKRIYVVGISMGGSGAWWFGAGLARRLAALVPICGANQFNIDPFSAHFAVPDIASVPTWAFHSFDDDNLAPSNTADVLDLVLPGVLFPGDRNILAAYPHRDGNRALAADGTYSYRWSDGKIGPWTKGALPPGKGLSFTLYPSGKHDAWTATYGNPGFWEWLYAQRR